MKRRLRPFAIVLSRVRADERGMLGGAEGIAFGLLVFVFGTFIVLNTWAIIDTKLAASAAAREAVRVFVESGDGDAARRIADETLNGHRHGNVVMTINGVAEAIEQRCAPVKITVTVDVPRIALPALGVAGGVTKVSADNSEVVDPYRSGIAGEATCA